MEKDLLGFNQKRRKKASYKPSPSNDIPLDVLIASLQKLGFSVSPPTTAQEIEKQQASVEKLGFAPIDKKSHAQPKRVEAELVGYLGIAHTRNGKVYGPGEVRLPRSKASLFNDLLAQDQLAKHAYMDTKEYTSRSKCFILKLGTGQDSFNKYIKQEVSEAVFNGDVSTQEAAVVAGNFDIAGHNPRFVNEHSSF